MVHQQGFGLCRAPMAATTLTLCLSYSRNKKRRVQYHGVCELNAVAYTIHPLTSRIETLWRELHWNNAGYLEGCTGINCAKGPSEVISMRRHIVSTPEIA